MDDLIDVPINNQVLVIDRLFAYWTRPRCCLLIQLVPRQGIKALHVNTLRRTARSTDPTVTQLDIRVFSATTV